MSCVHPVYFLDRRETGYNTLRTRGDQPASTEPMYEYYIIFHDTVRKSLLVLIVILTNLTTVSIHVFGRRYRRRLSIHVFGRRFRRRLYFPEREPRTYHRHSGRTEFQICDFN